jgi:hypothetical protein
MEAKPLVDGPFVVVLLSSAYGTWHQMVQPPARMG